MVAPTQTHIGSIMDGSVIARVGSWLARYGLAVVIAWIGALKFTSAEAHGIQPLVATSPLMSWVYQLFSVGTFSALLGVVELTAAVLLAVRPWWPSLSILGRVIAIGLFLTALRPKRRRNQGGR